MTAIPSTLEDQSLAALALVEAVIDDQPTNWGSILDTTNRDDLLVGLTRLAKCLILSLSVHTGKQQAEIVEMHRSLFLLTGDAA